MAFSRQIAKAAVTAQHATRSPASGHDNLHVGNHTGTWCWCKCSRCEQKFDRNKDGKETGKCICLDCPCRGSRVV